MPMKERVARSLCYLMLTIYPLAIAYVLIFTARPECQTFSEHINAYLAEPESIYLGKGLLLAFLLSLFAFIALLKWPAAHASFKLVVAYTWLVVIVLTLYWQSAQWLYVFAAGYISYEFYKSHKQKSI